MVVQQFKLGDNFLYGLTKIEKDEQKKKVILEILVIFPNVLNTLLETQGPHTKTTSPRGSSPIAGTLLNQTFPSLNEKPCVISEQ